ncbi:hypothetical protein BC936DRAFT_137068 [Jimgerdemannia flammicorona]|uniref:Uncharacterized protein n=2 Tax=Jimgerdemannia flammicorona TaxID=994334 RepID=A0A433QDF3_9FUNG|nr:hypothetical protein BC936DRAFT_137068 [Jimgerdemannia flammicorona]RUS27810.1 hypothetical protein BC938DRAFT_482703 [Jimgerdemannia flammicorona]
MSRSSPWDEAYRKNFPYYVEHLKKLNLPEQLSIYVSWIPFGCFVDVELLEKGGFATVNKGAIKWASGEYTTVIHNELRSRKEEDLYRAVRQAEPVEMYCALKEITPNMVTEVEFRAVLDCFLRHGVWGIKICI